MTKVNWHQIFFISLSAIIILLSTIPDLTGMSVLDKKSNISIIMLISMTLIATIGIAHGALDGKIIWEHSIHKSTKLKLYLLYMFFTSSGAVLWFFYPFAGLVLLLLMSSVHFGVSDLEFIKEMPFVTKVYWGIVMTYLPSVFRSDQVDSLFFDLTQVHIHPEAYNIIKIIVLICIINFLISLYKIAKTRKKMGKINYELKLLTIEMAVLIYLAYVLTPLIWFAIYFCGLHGIRALIAGSFRVFPDILWLLLFTSPVSIVIFLFEWEYNLNSLLLVFPIVASLTIAHMLLQKLIKIVGP